MSSVRSLGLDPATRPLLRGRAYVLRAFDASHAEKRVLVDARSGEVMSVRAVADTGPAEEQYNPRYGHYEPPRPPSRVAAVPESEPILDEPLFPRAGRGAPAAAPAKRSAALRRHHRPRKCNGRRRRPVRPRTIRPIMRRSGRAQSLPAGLRQVPVLPHRLPQPMCWLPRHLLRASRFRAGRCQSGWRETGHAVRTRARRSSRTPT